MLTMRSSADDMWMTYVSADDVRMTYMPADDVWMMYPPTDNVRMTYVIRQLKSPMKSHSRVIHTSSASHPHIVRTLSACRPLQDFNPKIFPVKEQRTALLKIGIKLERN